MEAYLNPGNEGFAEILRTEYVDKTGMIRVINNSIGTESNLFCICRPRRFGKSYAAQMLCAYYDKTCDSHALFDRYQISRDETYLKHLNKYHVIFIDMTYFVSETKYGSNSLQELPTFLSKSILEDVRQRCPEVGEENSLTEALNKFTEYTGTKIVFVIDEWDAVIREAGSDAEAKDQYMYLLRRLFKNGNFTPKSVAAVFMTGILPIKKDESQSALSNFNECSMLDPRGFAEYAGFTEDEVKALCISNHNDFESLKRWYDGYTVGDCRSIYNPYSVMEAISSGKCGFYWKKTSTSGALLSYIETDQDGLQEDIVRLIAGERIVVDPDLFENDEESFTCKDDVLTLLIHLGYLTYEEVLDSYDKDDVVLTGYAWIPNEEVRGEFLKVLRRSKHEKLIELVRKSDQLLADTLAGNADAVAGEIQEIHDSQYTPDFYDDEQCLCHIVKRAYISCLEQYTNVADFLSGHGIANVVFLPKKSLRRPAMIIELKRNKSSEGAINRILNGCYPKTLEKYSGKILLLEISYNEEMKKLACEISETDWNHVKNKASTCTDHIGYCYQSMDVMANYYGIKTGALRSRLSRGWSLEKALTTPADKHQTNTWTDHLGNQFQDFKSIATAYNIPKSTLWNRLEIGWDLERALTTPAKNSKKECYDHKGNKYPSIQAMAKAYGINISTLKYRLDNGMELEEALTMRQKISVKDHLGNEYKSIGEMLQKYGIPRNTFSQRIAAGASLQDALTAKKNTLRKVKDKYTLLQDSHGNTYNTLDEYCKAIGISRSAYYTRKKLGLPIEKPNKIQPVKDYKGIEYPSISAMCKAYGIHHQTFQKREKNGWTLKECLLGRKKKKKRVTEKAIAESVNRMKNAEKDPHHL